MTSEGDFEHEIKLLIDTAETQREEIKERYARELEQALASIDEKIEHYNCTLNDYLDRSGVPPVVRGIASDARLIESMRGVSYRQMLRKWGETHGGLIVMKDVVNFITDAGFVKKRMEAHRALYSAMAFAMSKGDFEKVGPGQYQLPQLDGEPRIPYQLRSLSNTG